MLGTPLPWPPVSTPPTTPTPTPTSTTTFSLSPHPSASPYSSKPPQPLTSPYKPHSKTSLSKTSQFIPRFQLSLSEQPPLQPLFTSKPLLSPKSQSLNFSYLINISVKYNDIQLTKAIHSSIIKIKDDVYLYNALIIAYLRLGEFSYARKVFYAIVSPDVVSYTALISGFVKVNCENEAIGLFLEMRRLGIEPNGYSFVALLSACMRLFDVEFGFQVHAYLLKLGYLCCTYVGNALMGLYSKCGYSDFVIELFDYMLVRDVASWNTAISCMVKESMFDSAFELFRKMFEINGLGADDYTISSLLCACGGCSAVMKGRELHAHAIKIGYESNLNVNNALIGFYSKLGSLKEVKSLFESVPQRDVYTWTEMVMAYMKFGIVDAAVEVFEKIPCKNCVSYNALLAGFCNNGEGSRAFNVFCTMVEEGVELTDYALTSALNACGLMKQRGTSEQIHAFVLKVGCGKNEHIEASLIDMCTRCDRMRDAEQMYHKIGLDLSNSVMLTTMICAYARNGQPEQAFSLFCKYKSEIYLVADEALVAAIIGVCGTLGLHDLGEQIYSQAIKGGFLSDIGIGNSMISMYSKCGKIKDASIIFDNMQKRDTVSWNCLIAGYILHRLGNKALNVWEKMKLVGEIPDSVTTLLVISAYGCTDHNLIDSCRDLLHSMQSTYQIKPTMEHYACFIRVLGYWGLLEEAEAIVNKMPFEPGPPIWRALLDSCRLGLNTTIGKRVAKNILSMEPQDTSTYILKSNLYSASGRWHCSEVVRNKMREKGFRKLPGRSWIIYQNMVHSFFARDKSHPQCKDIYSGLEILVMECLKAGYVPDTSFVLHEVEEYQKKEFLFYHSSKLAVTFGLLMSKPGKPIRVMKNIVLCGDCHTFFKYVSVVTKRDVYIRDASGFHCFVNGKCSCNDYW